MSVVSLPSLFLSDDMTAWVIVVKTGGLTTCISSIANLFLKLLTEGALTIFGGKLFRILTILQLKEYFR